MRPLYLNLRNFKGIKAGLGLDEIEIDLAKLPAGLVAVTGQNGAGKTTILDNLHPYRLMPYKLRESKEWSPGAFSYYDQTYGRDGIKELVFEMDDKRYKSVIFIDAEKRKQECYLYREEFDGWIPYNNAVKAGKTKEYDLAIEEICGSPSLFFSSVFRSQDARKLSSYPRSEILNIVTELLNIDHIRQQGEKANEVSKVLAGMVSDLEQKRSPIMDALAGRERLIARTEMLESEIASGEQDLRVYQGGLTAYEKQIHDLELAFAAEAVTRQRVEDMRKQQGVLLQGHETCKQESATRAKELLAELCRVDTAMRDERTAHFQDKVTLDNELATAQKQANKALSDIYEKTELAQIILNRADEITAAVSREAEEEATLSTARLDLERLREEYAALQKKQIDANNFLADIILKEHDRNDERNKRTTRTAELTREIERCQKQAGQLSSLDCKADFSGWINETCPLLVDAVAAKQKIPVVSKEIETLRDPSAEETALTAQIENMRAEHAAMGNLAAEAATCAAAGKEKATLVTRLETALVETRKTARLAADLETARTRMAELSEQAELITRDQENRAANHAQKVKDREAKSAVILADLQQQQVAVEAKQVETVQAYQQKLIAIQNQIDTLWEEIRKLEATLAGDMELEIVKLRDAMDTEKKSITTQEGLLKSLYGQRGTVQSQIDALAEREKQLASIESEILQIEEEMVNWNLLARACSNDGIIALELDDAGPSISALTNDLLRACYGSRFSVRLETQGIKADGGLKEIFDICVFDGERDEEKSIRDMSGGEVLYLEDAITRAFCLYNLHRANRQYTTLFSDEKDGALDESRKTEFLAIKRRAMELGHHKQEFFISQTSELIDRADARIILQKGGVTIQ